MGTTGTIMGTSTYLKEKNKIYIGKVAALSKKVKSLEAEVKILREQL